MNGIDNEGVLPGPGSYSPEKFDERTGRRGISIPNAGKKVKQSTENMPGPADYKNYIPQLYKSSPAIRIPVSSRKDQPNENPGPASYNVVRSSLDGPKVHFTTSK